MAFAASVLIRTSRIIYTFSKVCPFDYTLLRLLERLTPVNHNWTGLNYVLKCSENMRKSIYGPTVMGILLLTAINNSALHITLLSAIRYYIIVHPINAKLTLNCKLVMMMSFVFWIISFILAITMFLITFIFTIAIISYDAVIIVLFTNAAVVFVIPMVTIIVLHCLNIRALKRSPTIVTNVTKKMSGTLSVILIIFILINLTFIYHLSSVVSGSYPNYFFSLPYMFNFFINPIIYFLSSLPVKSIYLL